ncbi:MAG: beta-ketoacyl-ACP synthase II [Dehalococcoidia bacterium]|nr:beta-ketoacyl-ACP synthase II [Dehalococcoidia bacterium]MDD5494903.1 beta-ketoacyl-ACP synthase II [Dehalococcoidia bacterium]
MPERVAVTGMGAVTPLGHNVEDTWRSLVSGACGIGYISLFDTTDFDVRIAAEVKGFNPVDYIDPVTARYTDRFAQFALAAALQAVEQSGLKLDGSSKYDTGVLIGSGVGGIGTLSQQLATLNAKGPRRVSPFTVPMMIADSACGQISIKLGAMGPNFSLASSCSTGADAIGMAYRMIKHGEITAMIAGGADAAVTPIGLVGFIQAGAVTRNPDPLKACRPFDKQRDGFVIGEGAAVFVLENLDHAKARGARILAEVIGYGATSDAYHITKPLESGEGAAKAMELALACAGNPDVDYINAHGTSTPFNDLSETKAIRNVFGEKAYRIPVSSTKSMHAHMLGAAGAVETLICCKAVQEGVIPPTVNLETPDPDCDLDYVPGKARQVDVRVAMSNSFGFGGHNSAVLVSRYMG